MQPSEDILFGFVLNTSEFVVQCCCYRSWCSITIGDLGIAVGDATNRRDDSCSSTAEGFVCRHRKFSTDLLFNDFVAHVSCKSDDGITGDPRKDGSCQFRRVEDLVLDAEEVRSTDFFDVGTCLLYTSDLPTKRIV